MKYVYPAIFTPLDEEGFTGGYAVSVPDLPGCHTFGKDLADAIDMAQDAASTWIWDAENNNEEIPVPSATLAHEPHEFTSMVIADTDAFRRQIDSRAVKKTLSIPAWLNNAAEAAHVNFSSVLQDALKAHLGLTG